MKSNRIPGLTVHPVVAFALMLGAGCGDGGTMGTDSSPTDTGVATLDSDTGSETETGETETGDTVDPSRDLLDDHAFARLIGDHLTGYAGQGVAAAGDFDGDGNRDVLLSAPDQKTEATGLGAIYLAPGPFNGDVLLSEVASYSPGTEELYYLGKTIAGIGDLDGDGFDDVSYSVGAGGDNSALYIGCGGQLSSFGLEGSCARIHTDGVGHLGYHATSPTGDVNGDGLADLLTTSSSVDSWSGAAYLFYGPVLGEVEVTDAIWIVTGVHPDEGLGKTASADGDINGDGASDVALGAPNSYHGVGGGGVYLFHGPLTGSESGDDADDIWVGRNDGWAVSIYGDLDGDGYEDLVCGVDALGGDDVGDLTAAAVFSGGAGGIELSDRNPTAIVLADYESSGRWTFRSTGLGDLDGDGRDELGLTPTSGIADTPTLNVFRGPVEGNVEVDSADWVWFRSYEERSSASIAPGGDLDGDGRSDIILGVPDLSIRADFAGGAYLFSGADF